MLTPRTYVCRSLCISLAFVLLVASKGCFGQSLGQLMAGQWRCMVEDFTSGQFFTKHPTTCYPDVSLHLYTGWPPRRKVLEPRRDAWLNWSGWDYRKRTVVLVHGFNGGHEKAPLTQLRDAYLERGDFNVLVLDWAPLAKYPCYTAAVRSCRKVARCSAEVLTALRLSSRNTASDPRLATCVGHSLGAHICGMISNLLSFKFYKIVALDPALPKVENLLGSDGLDRGDARIIQTLHTNMGFYGDYPSAGHSGFCFNGGRVQPQCSDGTRFSRLRCSHFLSVCYFANLVRSGKPVLAAPCDSYCSRLIPGPPILFSNSNSDRTSGTFCLNMRLDEPCRIDL